MTEALPPQISPDSGFAEAVVGMAQGMTVPEELRGVHNTVPLEHPTEVSVYGAFDERLDYTRGCVLGDELSNPDVVVAFRLSATDRPARTVTIGRTPQGLQIPADQKPGAPGDFLLIAQDEDGSNPTSRYLDTEDVHGVMVRNGQQGLLLAGNTARQRQLQLPGDVGLLTAYRKSAS